MCDSTASARKVMVAHGRSCAACCRESKGSYKTEGRTPLTPGTPTL